MKRLKIYVDGASRGNPGDAGIGIVMLDEDGNVVKEICDYIGQTTNNIAEYTALVTAMKEAIEVGCEEIEVFSDSELMVKQIKGEYQIKNEGLKRLYSQVSQLMKEFRSFSINHVKREFNKRADELANEGIDMALGEEEVIDI
ncbi:MAG: ribonuclease HI family protein [Bacillota bacterium]